MNLSSSLWTALTLVVVGLVIAMLIGQLLGTPLVLGYVETGSMEPTLEPNDGFIALPPFLAGDLGEGDVITFDAQELEGGGLTTHRIVGVTDEGYITQGDDNLFTDQDGGEPVVTDAQVASVALQANGEVVRIPALGVVVSFLHGLVGTLLGLLGAIPGVQWLLAASTGMVLTATGLLLVAVSIAADWFLGDRRRTSRSRSREGYVRFSVILLVLLALILLPLTAGMVIPSGTHDTTIISSQSPSDNPTVIGVGESQEITYEVSNNGYVPRLVVLEPASEGVTVSDQRLQVAHGEVRETTVTLHAPETTGAYTRSVAERHYILLMPASIIGLFHDIHPWVAMLAINAFVGAVVVLVAVALLGTNPLRFRSTARNITLPQRLKRLLR